MCGRWRSFSMSSNGEHNQTEALRLLVFRF
jgi:hypothetical protein